MDLDFLTFQINLLLSLKQEAPLDENLRAVMAPTLSKLRQYCHASIAVHIFVNSELHELHALMLGADRARYQALFDELLRRHSRTLESSIPAPHLPEYRRITLSTDSDLPGLLSPLKDVRLERTSMGIIWLFEELRKVYREEFSEYSIEEGDPLILVPLGTGPYRRLGCIVLWAPSDILEECIAQPTKLEGIIGFRKGIEQLLIRLFTNFYHMASHTYLPSYYQIEQKPVALLCTEIREFDRISETLRLRRDFTREEAAECLRRLVNLFTQTTAQVIEKHHGRVDQIWGNGLLAIFGEYLDTPEPSSRVACMRATIAAAELVEKFREVAESWLKTVFKMEKFQQTNNELITLVPAVAVDYGEVVFDYVGSAKHRVYMAIGDHINFVKQLTSMAGRTERDHSAPEFLLHQILALTRREAKNPDELFYLVAPILLSQAAYAGARHILSERDGTFNGSLRRGRSISLPGRFTPYLVHELWPENVDRTAS